MKDQEQQLPDLTKILRVGDKVFDVRRGEMTVSSLNDGSVFPIICSPGYFSYTIDGRGAITDKLPALYPIDQAPPPPGWPTQPKTFEWEGEVYKAGEWVAVMLTNGPFVIHQLESIAHNKAYPIRCAGGLASSKMRKLSSFNQDPEPQD